MSAERLRQAADRLDALAEGATPTPWFWRHFGNDPDNLCRVVHYPADGDILKEPWSVVADEIWQGADAAYIAAMGPLVGKALAAWLRAVADNHDDTACPAADGALAVADAILGGAA